MVSVPLVPENSSVYSVFADITTLNTTPVVTWKSPSFITVQEIESKTGYWVFTTKARNITINGTQITNQTLSLTAGWNMLGTAGTGNLSLAIIPNQVPANPPVTWVSPLFVSVNETMPGKASWVFVTKATTV